MTELNKFIKKNELKFSEGRRNKDMLTLVGYSLFKGYDKNQIAKALEKQIKESSRTGDELDRVWDYASANNYGKWWENIEVVDSKIVK